jgi:hypothetical protein
MWCMLRRKGLSASWLQWRRRPKTDEADSVGPNMVQNHSCSAAESAGEVSGEPNPVAVT